MSEWLTDKEKRILFSALSREKKVCIEVDKQCEPREAYETSLKSICESLEYKFMYDHLFKDMEKQIRAELLDKVAEKIREYSGLHYVDCDGYFGGIEELIFKVDDWLDDIIDELKAEVSNDIP